MSAVLNYTLPVDPTIQFWRVVAVGWAGFLVVYVVVRWRTFPAAQAASLVLVGVLTLLQESQQLVAAHGHGAPFLVWRLPLWYALLIACAFTIIRTHHGR